MKKQAKILLNKSTESLIMSIDHFNRTSNLCRQEASLILLDRAVELLLKSAILHKGGKIRGNREKFNIGFDKCVKKCLSDEKVKCLNENQSMALQTLNSFRDAAQHDSIDMSEHELYTYSRSVITVYEKILKDVFNKNLNDYLPERVLLISTQPTEDFGKMMQTNFEDIKKLLKPNSRRHIEAKSKLKVLAIIEDTLKGDRTQPSETEIKKIVRQVKSGKTWQDIFPNMTSLRLSTGEKGLNVNLTVSKKEGEKISIVPEGEEEGKRAVSIRRVNELGYYSLGRNKLAEKIGITGPKTSALIEYLKIKDDSELYKEFSIGKVTHKRYSPKALDLMQTALENSVNIEFVWKQYQEDRRKNKR